MQRALLRRCHLEWQHHIADTIVDAEKGFPAKHLIAQNIANGTAKVANPHPAVSIFNFHYAAPPDAVRENWTLNKPIAFDETGFKGTQDKTYRAQAWHFLMAGGAVFSNLDYSFTAAHIDGTAPVTDPTPGGGSPALRRQLSVLSKFMESFDFLKMRPDNALLIRGIPPGVSSRTLSESGRAYAIYFEGGAAIAPTLGLPARKYRMDWIDTHTGAVLKTEHIDHKGISLSVQSPEYSEDVALRIVTAGYRRSYRP